MTVVCDVKSMTTLCGPVMLRRHPAISRFSRFFLSLKSWPKTAPQVSGQRLYFTWIVKLAFFYVVGAFTGNQAGKPTLVGRSSKLKTASVT